MIEQDEVGLRGGSDAGDLFDFARADEGSGIWLGTALEKFGCHGAAGADKQFAKFGERLFSIEGSGMNGAPRDQTAIAGRNC